MDSGKDALVSRLEHNAADATGWDPYEVWRTRVLLPRLANVVALPIQANAGPAAGHNRAASDEMHAREETLRNELSDDAVNHLLIACLALTFVALGAPSSQRHGR